MKPTLLMSFAYYRKNAWMSEFLQGTLCSVDWLVDSGAFTQHSKRGQTTPVSAFTMADYVAECHAVFHGRVVGYVQYDVIGDYLGTLRNLLDMRERGLSPIPVYVMGDFDAGRVRELFVHAPDGRICIAGGVGTPLKYAVGRYLLSAEALRGKPHKIHALGFVRLPHCLHLPLATVDSSSWAAGGMFGTVYLFNPAWVVRYGTPLKSFSREKLRPLLDVSNGSPLAVDVRRALGRCGLGASDLSDEAKWRTWAGIPALIATREWVRFSAYSKEEWGLGVFPVVASTTSCCAVVAGLWWGLNRSASYADAAAYYRHISALPVGELCEVVSGFVFPKGWWR